MIHFYYGYGKGKTSSAVGLGMRANGAGLKVLFVQFLKDNKSSELNAVPFEVFTAPDKLPFNPSKEEYQPWVDLALDAVSHSDCDLIILDEFADVINSFIPMDYALKVLDTLTDKEVVITGHIEFNELVEKADYVTHFGSVKHPYTKGVKARKGIEY